MSDTSYSLKRCPHCGAASYRPVAPSPTGEIDPCPNCGVVLAPSLPGGAQAQLQVPIAVPQFLGPLLTGSVRGDRALGLSVEIAGLALLIYSFATFYSPFFGRVTAIVPLLLTVLGTVATAWCLFKYADTMRQRYPSFERGWQAGRDSWGRVVEHLITLLFGVGVLVVFTPVTGVLFEVARQNGAIAWFFIAVIAYGLGWVVRRIGRPWKERGTP